MDWDLSFLFSIRGAIASTASFAIVILCLRNHFFALLMLLALVIIGPHQMEIFPGIESIPVVKVFSVVLLLSVLIHYNKISSEGGRIWSFTIVVMSMLFVVLFTSGKGVNVSSYFFVYFFPKYITFFIICFVTNKMEDVRKLILTLYLCTSFIAFYCVYQYNIPGGHVFYDTGMSRVMYWGQLNDPNATGAALSASIPIGLFYLFLCKTNKQKIIVSCSIVAHVTAAILTYSRGTFLSLGIVAAMLALTSKRKIAVTSALIIVCLGAFVVAPWDYKNRVLSIGKVDDQSGQMEASSQSRINLWIVGFNMIKDNMMTGVGMGQYIDNVRKYCPPNIVLKKSQTAHNTFILIAAEAGMPGLILFSLLVYITLINLVKVIKHEKQQGRDSSDIYFLTKMLVISFLSLQISNMFLSKAYGWFFYTYVAIIFRLKYVYFLKPYEKNEIIETQEKPSPA